MDNTEEYEKALRWFEGLKEYYIPNLGHGNGLEEYNTIHKLLYNAACRY